MIQLIEYKANAHKVKEQSGLHINAPLTSLRASAGLGLSKSMPEIILQKFFSV